MLAGDPDRQDRADVETTLSGLEASWGQEIAALRTEIARQQGPRHPDQLRLSDRAGPAAVAVRLRPDRLMSGAHCLGLFGWLTTG
jgi:hypothetical protein